METKLNVTVSRKWKEREITTIISGSSEGIEISMPLSEFLIMISAIAQDALTKFSERDKAQERVSEVSKELAALTVENLSVVSTRAQVKRHLDEATAALVKNTVEKSMIILTREQLHNLLDSAIVEAVSQMKQNTRQALAR